MPVTLTKAKPKVKAPETHVNVVEVLEPEKLSDEALVDQYGHLQDEIIRLQANPVFAQMQLVEQELKARLDKYEPDELVQITAHQYLLEAGACALEQRRVVDPLKVLKWIGPEAFAKIAKVGVTDAEKYLNPEQCEEVISVPGFTKNRKIKVKYLGK